MPVMRSFGAGSIRGFLGSGGIPGLYPFSTFTFTNAGVTGRTGPSLAQCRTAYSAQSWTQNTAYFNMVAAGMQDWTVPATRSYSIQAFGAAGGYAYDINTSAQRPGGQGASITGTFALTSGDKIRLLVGQKGGDNSLTTRGGGGGGGTYIYNVTTSTLLLVAGAGGGAGNYDTTTQSYGQTTTSGTTGLISGGAGGLNGAGGGSASYSGGGAGWVSSGASSSYGTGGLTFSSGGTGGALYSDGRDGGFGGGGGCYAGAGGGGGYSGGGAGGWSYSGAGGGGGSYNTGTNQTNTLGGNLGHGSVVITGV